jgi:RNA polymerase sigma-70 factor (ECF subfamily)
VSPAERRSVSEPELIVRILRGERQLFHDLVRPYERAVYVTAYAVLRRREDAEEAAQETMLKALMHLNQLVDRGKFKPWLLHIALNEARLKRRDDHGSLFEPIENTEDGGSDADGMFMPRDFADWRELPSETLERKEVRIAISGALQKLPAIYRGVFVLRDVEQLSTGQCAQALGISEQAVKVRLHRARLKMREDLAPVFRKNWLERLVAFKGKKPW